MQDTQQLVLVRYFIQMSVMELQRVKELLHGHCLTISELTKIPSAAAVYVAL